MDSVNHAIYVTSNDGKVYKVDMTHLQAAEDMEDDFLDDEADDGEEVEADPEEDGEEEPDD